MEAYRPTLAIDLWHGSSRVIKHPEYGLVKPNNDYGRGFYCTRSVDAGQMEWACAGLDDGFANRYTLATNGLTFLDLSQLPYTILNWLALLVENRRFQPTTTVAAQGIEYLKQVFLPDTRAPSDVIVVPHRYHRTPTIRISRSPALLSITRFPSTNSPRRCGWVSSASRSYSPVLRHSRRCGSKAAKSPALRPTTYCATSATAQLAKPTAATALNADLDGLFMRTRHYI